MASCRSHYHTTAARAVPKASGQYKTDVGQNQAGICFSVVLQSQMGCERLLGLLLLPQPQGMSPGVMAAPENPLISSLDLNMVVYLAGKCMEGGESLPPAQAVVC